MNNTKNFLANLKDTLIQRKEVLAENSEIIYDMVTNSETMKEIPFVKWGVSLLSIKDTYHETRLKRNIYSFIKAVEIEDIEKIQAFSANIELNEKQATEITDTMMAIFVDSEKPLKAKIMGKLAKALADNSITSEEFHRALLVIIGASVPALHALEKWFHANSGQTDVLTSDLDSPLITNLPLVLSLGVCLYRGDRIKIDKLGEILFKYGMG